MKEEILTQKQRTLVELAIQEKIPILIIGKHRATGKSTLCEELKKKGADVKEEYEINTILKNNRNCVYFTIILNRELKHLDNTKSSLF